MESVVTNLPEIKSEIKAEDFCVTADTSVTVSTSSSTSTGNVTPTNPSHQPQTHHQQHLDSTTQVQQQQQQNHPQQQPSQTQLHPNSCNWVGKPYIFLSDKVKTKITKIYA